MAGFCSHAASVIVDGGLGAQEITGFVVLLDGIACEPLFNTDVIVIQTLKGLGY